MVKGARGKRVSGVHGGYIHGSALTVLYGTAFGFFSR